GCACRHPPFGRVILPSRSFRPPTAGKARSIKGGGPDQGKAAPDRDRAARIRRHAPAWSAKFRRGGRAALPPALGSFRCVNGLATPDAEVAIWHGACDWRSDARGRSAEHDAGPRDPTRPHSNKDIEGDTPCPPTAIFGSAFRGSRSTIPASSFRSRRGLLARMAGPARKPWRRSRNTGS